MASASHDSGDRLRTPAAPATASILVLGSKFLAVLAPAASEEEAMGALKERSRRYPDASHHCWGLRVGRPAALVERSSDAGEPNGTAGRPILDALRHAQLENAVCVVTRYFGGTKLGTGGLARAYGDAANAAIAAATMIEQQVMRVVRIDFEHERTGAVYRALEEFGVILREGRYDERAHGVLHVPVSKAHALRARIAELAHSGIGWQEGELILV
ncbi:MAG TPA: YigZ family protein [bacterium]|nr:YigZ family protein [bacterium]